MIDAPIQKAIKILNDNGKTTRYCCAGHYRGENKFCEIQVLFFKAVDSAPDGWKKSKENICYDFFPKNIEEFKAIQEKEINKLIEWGMKE